jgi:D-glycero-alpha-D-manno-heptose 1-phosphate guanylyltransferase
MGAEAVILAGGYGTRLQAVVRDVPKPLAPVRNRPFLEYVFDWLSGYNVTSILMTVGYKADAVISWFGSEYKGIPLVYAYESEPLGTGGGILNALDYIRGKDFLALNGDTFFPVDLNALFSLHRNSSARVTVALKEMPVCNRFGSVRIDNDQNIVSFKEKTSGKKGLINGGLYVINTSFLKNSHFPARCSFENDILEKSIASGRIKGMVFNDTFIDIGVPDDYRNAASII